MFKYFSSFWSPLEFQVSVYSKLYRQNLSLAEIIGFLLLSFLCALKKDQFMASSLNPVWAREGQICPPLHEILNFLFSLCKHMLRLVDFSCMFITVLLQNRLASYVPWFNFDGIFFDKKSGFQIANFKFFSNFAKNGGFSKSSQGYIF